ncbi:MAG: ABC transporter permease [Sphingomicrobium sp.]
MWRNYLHTALRSLAKSPMGTLINVAGLSLGLAAFVLIMLFVRYETSYDAWLPGADRAFQLQQWNIGGDGGPGTQMTSFRSGTALRKDFPQIDRVVYVGKSQPAVIQDGEASVAQNFVYVDGPLFDILQLPFLAGDRSTALSKPGQLVLTGSEATRRFGTPAAALGRTLTLVAGDKSTDYTVSGVVADPRHSHLALSIVARYDPDSYFAGAPQFLTNWMMKNGWVYARLRPGARVDDIMRQMPAWKHRNIPDEIAGGQRDNPGDSHDWKLINVRDIHLGVVQDSSMTPGNDRRTIVTFVTVAILILGMAIVNFINLATARAGIRAREIAIRKLVGASRRHLILQFLGESVALTAVAMLVAMSLVELALPPLNAFLHADIQLAYFGADGVAGPVALLALAVGLVAGLYPAFYLSRFRPAQVLKANRSAADTPGAGRLRTALVVAQFAVAIGLFVCTSVVAAQTRFARTVDPGFDRTNLIQVANINRRALASRIDALSHEIAKVDGVKAMGRSTIGVATWGMDNMLLSSGALRQPVELNLYRIDTHFFDTMRVKLLAGRGFTESRSTDDSTVDIFADDSTAAQTALAARGYGVIVNREAARQLGFRDPEAAVGVTMRADDESNDIDEQAPVTIIGVVENSRFRSIRDPIEPMIFLYDRLQPRWLVVRYDGNAGRVRAEIERLWKRIAPDVPFEAQLSEDIVQDLYSADAARAMIFAGFSALAVVIGSLGLFGLAAFTAERRTKEIGIRKVLGARVRDIVQLLAWQFSKPVILANLVAWPVAWWAMRDWLNGFDVRIPLTPGPFVMAGLLALVIAIATVAGHAIRVARLSPIHALRYE